MHYFIFIYLTTLLAVKLLLAFASAVILGISSRLNP
jgi:hypothetical protein